MAKKSDQKFESRVLSKVMSGAGYTIAADGTPTGGGSDWNTLNITAGAVNYLLIYNIQTFDLSGYTLQDLTLFPQGVLFQDMNRGPAGSTPQAIQRLTLLSTTPLSEDSFSSIGASGLSLQWDVPGSSQSTFNLNNILSARYQDFVTLTTFAGVQQVKESMYGSGDSTAGESMWFADAYLVTLTGSPSAVWIPSTSVVIPTMIGKEPDLEYLMRLSRSLEPVY